MHILALAPESPFPPNSGGKARTYHLLRELSREHEVTLVTFADRDGQASDACPPFAVEVVRVPYVTPPLYMEMYGADRERSEAAFRTLARDSREPWFVTYYACPEMERALERITRRQRFDLILIEHTFMGRFLQSLPHDVPKVLDLHNVHSLMGQREATDGGDEEERVREAVRIRQFEQAVCAACQACWVCSEAEAAAATDLLDIHHPRVVPNGVDTSQFVTAEGGTVPGRLLFTGTMNYWPNVEAACFFTTKVLPRIRAAVPAARFHIVGAKPTQEVTALESADVVVYGAVPDMRPHLREADIVVVPLLHGGGTRLKILDAAACGKAIVTTPLGAEGLPLHPGEDAVFAESAVALAHEIVLLLADPDRRESLGRNARRVAERYDWSLIGARARKLVREVSRSESRDVLECGRLTARRGGA
jgi:polysaccharide biosynthesis protein PslH